MKIRLSNGRPEVGTWTVTLASHDMFEYGAGAFGWKRARFGIFKLTKEIPEGAYLAKDMYKGFLLNWQYWSPFRKGIF